VDRVHGPARGIATDWRAAGIRRVYVIGNGTSYHSCLAAATLYRRLAGTDDPVVIPVTAAELRIYPPALGPGDAIVGISSSGEFRDVVGVAEAVRGRVRMAGIVHVPGSTLARLTSDVLVSAGGPSVVPVMTKTFSSTLVATELLLLELLGPERAGPVATLAGRRRQAAIAAAEPRPLAASPRTRATFRQAPTPAALEAAPSSRRWRRPAEGEPGR
jgi:DNA-binding MurR/RpiR family transcriptional regulator